MRERTKLGIMLTVAIVTALAVVVLLCLAIRTAPRTEELQPVFQYGLSEGLNERASEANCLAAQEGIRGILDPSNCIGNPKTPGKLCTPKDVCWIYCRDNVRNCGPRGVS